MKKAVLALLLSFSTASVAHAAERKFKLLTDPIVDGTMTVFLPVSEAVNMQQQITIRAHGCSGGWVDGNLTFSIVTRDKSKAIVIPTWFNDHPLLKVGSGACETALTGLTYLREGDEFTISGKQIKLKTRIGDVVITGE